MLQELVQTHANCAETLIHLQNLTTTTTINTLWPGHATAANMSHLEYVLCRVPVKRLDTPTHSRVFLYFDYFLHCKITVKTFKL